MYEETYGTDWDAISDDEAIERAYALGVGVSLGEEHPDELDRLVAASGSAYGQSIVSLAFDEGRTRARTRADGDGDDGQVWSSLVENADRNIPDTATDPPEGIPGSVRRATLLDRSGDDLDRLSLPDFLRR